LNRMISNIGFGRYHRRVLALCGLGWLADNMWMQCVACVLPRIQQHFAISNSHIGIMSSSMFLGLMSGALFWGPISDKFGRLVAYRWTLVVSATFGLLASAAPTFSLLCLCLFGLGSGVGGNMPVDGAIFLEFIPREKRHLLTLLSVFFSIGSVLTSAVALVILPPLSCPDDSESEGCDVSKQNSGWRYLLVTMSLVTLVMVVLRNGCFRLYESPKFLLQHKRRSDVVVVLKKIVHFNGGTSRPLPPAAMSRDGQDEANEDAGDYEFSRSQQDTRSRTVAGMLESCIKGVKGAADINGHVRTLQPLFSPSLRRTTILIWLIWSLVAMGFTMFNVFLPKLLETRGGEASSSRQPSANAAGSHAKQVAVYRDALIYAVSGIPGSVLGAWMVDTRLGRIYSMAIATFTSGLALTAFALTAKAHSPVLTTVSSSVFGLMSSLMFAVIYAYTPEVFHPSIRGTACGMASALGRVAGIIAPLITGLLLELSSTLPMYISVALLWAASVCMVALPIETR
ncbi:MFS general substrate transporter, partial [Martensiomyces pterosporus]